MEEDDDDDDTHAPMEYFSTNWSLSLQRQANVKIVR